MKNNYTLVNYKDKRYIVAKTNNKVPFIFNYDILEKLPNSNFFLRNNYVSCKNNNKEEYLHHIVKPFTDVSIDHINQIKQDNRRQNLRYANQSIQNQNQSKRKRVVNLPENCGINPQNIPTFIWYIKDDGRHGDRWMVEIKDKYIWKTTSTKDLSTKCKFELAKKHLRNLIITRPELFIERCINGKLGENAQQLKKEFIEILKLARYEYKEEISNEDCLKEDIDGLTEHEINILRQDNDYKHKNRPDNFDISNIPKYCYYIKATKDKGDAFCCTKLHPKQKESGKDWTTTKSKKVSIEEKYKQLLEYLDNNIYNPKENIIIPQKTSPKKEITPSDKFKLLDNQQLLTIIKMKCENKTTQEVSNYIKENFNIYINRNFISKLWNGENVGLSEVILNSTEYQDMIQNTKQRNVQSKKFTKDEIAWVLSNNLDKSLSQRVILFQEQFNKTITKTYLSKL